MSLIKSAKRFIEYYMDGYDERINYDNLEMIFNTDGVMYDFEDFLMRSNIDMNKNIKSYYVRYCNKYYKENYGNENCIKYKITNRKLIHNILYVRSMYMREYIINLVKDNDLWDSDE